jgi:hypothetical protein
MRIMIGDLQRHRDRIDAKRAVLIPDVRWSGRREKVHVLEEEEAQK